MNSVLILNGSPHPDGHSMALARRVADRLGGCQDVVDLYRAGVRPCCGCRTCAAGGGCVLDGPGDGFAAVMARMRSAAYVLMASPLHFSGLSAPLVGCISRFQVYWGRDVGGMFPGVAGVAATGGAEYPEMFVAVRKVAGAAFKTLGIPLAGMAAVGGTDALPAAANPAALALADGLAERMLAVRSVRTTPGNGEPGSKLR